MAIKNTLISIFTLLTIANAFIFLNRNNGFEYIKQSSYHDLYPNNSKGISEIYIKRDSNVIINLKGYTPNLKWHVRSNDSLFIRDQFLPIQIPLRLNKNRYFIESNDTLSKPIIIDLDYAPKKVYQERGNSTQTNYEITYCNESFVTPDSLSVSKWKDTLPYIDAEEIKAVRQILYDSLNLTAVDSTVVKIKIIGAYIYQSIKNHIGIPADSLTNYSAYQQFCFVKEGKAKIWCGNITDIFHLFVSIAGITCRKVGLSGKRGEFAVGNHSLNECYLPETGEWASIDITQNILLLKDKSGRMMNTVNLYQLKKLNQTDNLVMYYSNDDSVFLQAYSAPDQKYLWEENEILFPHPHNPKALYSFLNKMTRYISWQPWLEVYSETQTYNNSRFYLKIYLFYSWIAIGILTFVSFFFTNKQTH